MEAEIKEDGLLTADHDRQIKISNFKFHQETEYPSNTDKLVHKGILEKNKCIERTSHEKKHHMKEEKNVHKKGNISLKNKRHNEDKFHALNPGKRFMVTNDNIKSVNVKKTEENDRDNSKINTNEKVDKDYMTTQHPKMEEYRENLLRLISPVLTSKSNENKHSKQEGQKEYNKKRSSIEIVGMKCRVTNQTTRNVDESDAQMICLRRNDFEEKGLMKIQTSMKNICKLKRSTGKDFINTTNVTSKKDEIAKTVALNDERLHHKSVDCKDLKYLKSTKIFKEHGHIKREKRMNDERADQILVQSSRKSKDIKLEKKARIESEKNYFASKIASIQRRLKDNEVSDHVTKILQPSEDTNMKTGSNKIQVEINRLSAILQGSLLLRSITTNQTPEISIAKERNNANHIIHTDNGKHVMVCNAAKVHKTSIEKILSKDYRRRHMIHKKEILRKRIKKRKRDNKRERFALNELSSIHESDEEAISQTTTEKVTAADPKHETKQLMKDESGKETAAVNQVDPANKIQIPCSHEKILASLGEGIAVHKTGVHKHQNDWKGLIGGSDNHFTYGSSVPGIMDNNIVSETQIINDEAKHCNEADTVKLGMNKASTKRYKGSTTKTKSHKNMKSYINKCDTLHTESIKWTEEINPDVKLTKEILFDWSNQMVNHNSEYPRRDKTQFRVEQNPRPVCEDWPTSIKLIPQGKQGVHNRNYDTQYSSKPEIFEEKNVDLIKLKRKFNHITESQNTEDTKKNIEHRKPDKEVKGFLSGYVCGLWWICQKESDKNKHNRNIKKHKNIKEGNLTEYGEKKNGKSKSTMIYESVTERQYKENFNVKMKNANENKIDYINDKKSNEFTKVQEREGISVNEKNLFSNEFNNEKHNFNNTREINHQKKKIKGGRRNAVHEIGRYFPYNRQIINVRHINNRGKVVNEIYSKLKSKMEHQNKYTHKETGNRNKEKYYKMKQSIKSAEKDNAAVKQMRASKKPERNQCDHPKEKEETRPGRKPEKHQSNQRKIKEETNPGQRPEQHQSDQRKQKDWKKENHKIKRKNSRRRQLNDPKNVAAQTRISIKKVKDKNEIDTQTIIGFVQNEEKRGQNAGEAAQSELHEIKEKEYKIEPQKTITKHKDEIKLHKTDEEKIIEEGKDKRMGQKGEKNIPVKIQELKRINEKLVQKPKIDNTTKTHTDRAQLETYVNDESFEGEMSEEKKKELTKLLLEMFKSHSSEVINGIKHDNTQNELETKTEMEQDVGVVGKLTIQSEPSSMHKITMHKMDHQPVAEELKSDIHLKMAKSLPTQLGRMPAGGEIEGRGYLPYEPSTHILHLPAGLKPIITQRDFKVDLPSVSPDENIYPDIPSPLTIQERLTRGIKRIVPPERLSYESVHSAEPLNLVPPMKEIKELPLEGSMQSSRLLTSALVPKEQPVTQQIPMLFSNALSTQQNKSKGTRLDTLVETPETTSLQWRQRRDPVLYAEIDKLREEGIYTDTELDDVDDDIYNVVIAMQDTQLRKRKAIADRRKEEQAAELARISELQRKRRSWFSSLIKRMKMKKSFKQIIEPQDIVEPVKEKRHSMNMYEARTTSYHGVTLEHVGETLLRGFRTDRLNMIGDRCFLVPQKPELGDQITVMSAIKTLQERGEFNVTPDLITNLREALNLTMKYYNEIGTQRMDLLVYFCREVKPPMLPYFSLIVEAIINRRINDKSAVLGYILILSLLGDGTIKDEFLLGQKMFTLAGIRDENRLLQRLQRKIFSTAYRKTTVWARRYGEKTPDSVMDMLRQLPSFYRSGLLLHFDLLSQFIGEQKFRDKSQLEGAIINLMSCTKGSITPEELEEWCGIGVDEEEVEEEYELKEEKEENGSIESNMKFG